MATKTNITPANVPANVPANSAPTLESIIKKAFKNAGISITMDANAAKHARQELTAKGAVYVPTGNMSDLLLIVANDARANMEEQETAGYRAAIELAAIDKSGAYAQALNANGKPYRSVAALAKDLFPQYQHSTLMNLIGNGRAVYLPALNAQFDKQSNANLLKIAPSVADKVKSLISDDKTRDDALKAINAEFAAKGRLTKAKAVEIVRDIKTGDSSDTGRNDQTAKASKAGDTNAQLQVAQMSEQAAYNDVLLKALQWVPQQVREVNEGDIHIVIPSAQIAEMKKYVTDAVKSTDANVKNRLIKALAKVIIG